MANFVQIDGVRALVRQLALIDPKLRKELGQRNKGIGARIIARAMPHPLNVGAGTGATPRASAATNELRIMAGGKHRAHHVQQWGPRVVERTTARPYLLRSAQEQQPDIEKEYLDALASVARQAGLTFRRI